MKKNIATLLLLIATQLIFAAENKPEERNLQGLADETAISKFCNEFMKKALEGDFQKAFSLTKAIWPIEEKSIAKLESKVYEQMPFVKKEYGQALNYQFLEKKEKLGIVSKWVFIIKHEKHLIRWVFVFYKPEDTWYLNHLSFDDKIQKVF